MRTFILSSILTFLFALFPTTPQAASGNGLNRDNTGQPTSTSLNPDRAIEQVRKLAKQGKYNEALVILTPYCQSSEKYPKIYTDYLVLLVWAGKYQEAIQRFEKLPQSFVKRLYLLETMAKGYAAQQRYFKAVSLYEIVAKLDSDNDQAQLGLIQNLIKLKQFQKAGRLLNTFLTKHPDQFPLQLVRAGLLMQQEDYLLSLRKYRELAQNFELEQSRIALHKENSIAVLSSAQRKALLDQLKKSVVAGNDDYLADYLISLVLHSDYGQAIQELFKSKKRLDDFSVDLQYWIAWAYFKRGKTVPAQEIYNSILQANPDYERAKLGIIYCMARNGKQDEALKRLQELGPKSTSAQFARAYIFEQSGRLYDALQLYDELLASNKNWTTQKLRLQVIATLGAPSIALEKMSRQVPVDEQLRYTFLGDFAMDDIHWQEPANALRGLSQLMKENDILRNRYDYLIALAENDDLEETRNLYEKFVEEQIFLPYWVKNNAAKAYLHFDEPKKALKLYNEVLNDNPHFYKKNEGYETRLGKFYSLQDLRLWQEAEDVLASLERDYPLFQVRKNGSKTGSENGEEIALIKGWSLVAQDRFREAEDYLGNLYRNGPANLKVRNGLAYNHYWRGWPRKAMQEFNIINTLDPDYVSAATGRISVLNDLAYKEEAREYVKELMAKHPKNKNVRRINHLLEVEQMRELVTDVVWYQEEPDSEDLLLKLTLFQPLGLNTRLYGFWLWNETSDRELMQHVKRAGIGVDHIFNSTWKIRQQFSINYDTGKEFGSLTRVNFTPNDYWHVQAAYDSYAVDIPMRARVHGIDAKKYEAGITYRESDWRSYSIGISRYEFSDTNKRDQLLLTYKQGLWTKHDWKLRLLLDFYGSRNSRKNTPYFNPDHDYSLSATLLTEKLVRRTTDSSFKHRLFLTGGIYDQADFDREPLWSVRYEQEYDFCDEHALLIGATWTNRAYDGVARDSLALYLTYRYHF